MKLENWLALISFLATWHVRFEFSSLNLNTRYRQTYIQKIQFPGKPPTWLFGIVWFVIYTLIGTAGYLFYVNADPTNTVFNNWTLGLYWTVLIPNKIWTLVFFDIGKPTIAAIILFINWALAVAVLVLFAIEPVTWWPFGLYLPHVLWVSYALYLNIMAALRWPVEINRF